MQAMVLAGMPCRLAGEWRTALAAVRAKRFAVLPTLLEGSFDEVLLAQVLRNVCIALCTIFAGSILMRIRPACLVALHDQRQAACIHATEDKAT